MCMKKAYLLIIVVLGLSLTAMGQTKQKFDPAYAVGDYRVEFGALFETREGGTAPMLNITRNHQLWGPIAWRAGVQFATSDIDNGHFLGLPLGIAYCPGTRTLAESLVNAAEASIVDVVVDGISGNSDRIWEDILVNFAIALFRRTEYYVGITPGWYGGPRDMELGYRDGSRFSTTLDAGIVLSLPIRRVALLITPAYHYSLTKNLVDEYGDPLRHFGSVTVGFSYLF